MLHTLDPARRRAPRVPGPLLVSLSIHAAGLAFVALGTGIATDPSSGIAEGLVFLAPPPSVSAGPAVAVERLTFSELTGQGGTAEETGAGGFAEDHSIAGAGTPVGGLVAGEGPETVPTLQPVIEEYPQLADSVYLGSQVDDPVAYDANSAAPAYPDSLRLAGVEGVVRARFVVDTAGRVELFSVVLLESTHRRFTESVRTALPGMLFRPAQLNGRKIKQLVELPFVFRIEKNADSTGADTTAVTPAARSRNDEGDVSSGAADVPLVVPSPGS